MTKAEQRAEIERKMSEFSGTIKQIPNDTRTKEMRRKVERDIYKLLGNPRR